MSTVPPTAIRGVRRTWRDPRMLIGIGIMAVSLLLGAWALGSADDTVSVLAARHSLPAGATLGADDVESRQVHFAQAGVADHYLSGDDDLAAGTVLARPLGAGELVPRASLADPGGEPRIEVPLSVAIDDLPATVTAGSLVDVWVVPDKAAAGSAPARARPVLRGVTVLELATGSDSLAPDSTRQVIVTIPETEADQLPTALGRATSGRLVLTRLH